MNYLLFRLIKKIRGLPSHYKGFTIQLTPYKDDNIQSEGQMVFSKGTQKTTEAYELKCGILPETAERLFKHHTNLTLICPSLFKSKCFKRKHDVKKEMCIQLFCKTKGIIHVGEKHFPKTIQGIPTDVLQERTILFSKQHVGDRIGTQYSICTLGGFVKYLDFNCFITCAHVMYDIQTLLSASTNYKSLPGSSAVIHNAQRQIDCGKVIRKIFDHDDPHKTSIDAALALLTGNFQIDLNDYILDIFIKKPCPYLQLGLSSPFLNDSCLDHEELCIKKETATIVAASGITKLQEQVTFPNQSEIEVVFNSLGQTSVSANGKILNPFLLNSPAHMQLSTGQLTHQRVFCMYNQIVLKLDLKAGDSGTCIYVVQSNKNGCLGMAIAFCGGITIVTPMKDILKRFNSS